MAVLYSLLLLFMALGGCTGQSLTIDRNTDFLDDDLRLDGALLCPNIQPKCDTFNALPLGGCWCHCGSKNSSFYEPEWKCKENTLIRSAGGCNDTLFIGDSRDKGLPVLSSDDLARKEIQVPPNMNCSLHFTSGPRADYVTCDGAWVPIDTNAIPGRIELTSGWSTSRLSAKVIDGVPGNLFLDGRIVRLYLQCKPQNAEQPTEDSCVMFAIKGRILCPHPQATVPPVLTTVQSSTEPTTNQETIKSKIPSTQATLKRDATEGFADAGKSGNRSQRDKNTYIIAGAAAGGLLLIALIIITIWRLRRPKRRDHPHRRLVGTISRPISQNGRNSIPVYTDAANMYQTDNFLERTRSMDNPTYRKSSDGIIFMRGPDARKGSAYSDQFSPTSAPPRPPPGKRGSVEGQFNPALSLKEDVVTMNPLYEGNLLEHKDLDGKRNGMGQSSFGVSPWVGSLDPRVSTEDQYQTYDIPEEVLAREQRKPSPHYYVLEEPYPDSITSTFPANGKALRGRPDGHVYDEPEADLSRRPYVVMGNSNGRAQPYAYSTPHHGEQPLSFRRLSTPEQNSSPHGEEPLNPRRFATPEHSNGNVPDSPYRDARYVPRSEYDDVMSQKVRIN